jgi:DNA polymerase-4
VAFQPGKRRVIAMAVVCVQLPGPPGETQDALFRLLQNITPMVAAVSPHTVLADVSGSTRYFDRDAVDIARLVRVRTLALLGLDCAVGVGPNPLLARMAAQDGPPGVVRSVADTPQGIAEFLDPKPVAALHGVGPKAARTLCGYGLDRIGRVAEAPETTLHRILGVRTGRLVHEHARGIDRSRVVPHAPQRSISTEWRFDRHEVGASARQRILLRLADDIGRDLRTDGQVARALTLTVRYADRSTTTRTRRLSESTAHTPALADSARALHDSLGLQRARVSALSLKAEDLLTAQFSSRQLTFDRRTESALRLEPVIDRISARWPGSVGPATLVGP